MEKPTSVDRSADVVLSLATVRVLYSTDRRAAEYDILVATIVECLAGGGRTQEQIIPAVQRVWPGTKVNELNILAALGAAEAANLVHVTDGIYRLSEAGLREVDKSRQWAEEVYRRTADGLTERAARGLRPITTDEAKLWVGFLSYALLNAIATASAAYKGEVNLRGDALVTPRSIDQEAIAKSLRNQHISPEVQEFLEAMVLEAIDPTVPFGNDLVSSITTGYLLQAFVARRDALGARETVGSIDGQLAILDTPILFQLVSPPSQPSPLLIAIRAAAQAGCRVVVCQHSLDELEQVLRRVERKNATEISGAIQNARTLAVFRGLVAEPLIRTFLEGFSAKDFKDWAAFRRHVGGLVARLEADGVEVVHPELSPDDRADELFSRLGSVLAERPSGRGDEETRRDSRTMALAYQARRQSEATDSMWPVSWVITTDTAMSLAYRRFNKADPAAMTISPSQWMSVLSVFSEPAQIEELARSGATMLAQETMLRVAARYPAEAVAEIAAALAETSSETDIRVAQLSLDDVLREVPDVGLDPKALGIAVASKMLEQRSARLEVRQAQFEAEIGSEREKLAREREALKAAADSEARRHRDELEAERQLRIQAEAAAREQKSKSSADRASSRRRLIQVAITIVVAAAAVLLGVVWLTSDGLDFLVGPGSIALAVSAVVFAATSEAWVDGTDGPRRMLWALIPQLLALPGLLNSFGIELPWQ